MTKKILSWCGESCLEKIENALVTVIGITLGSALLYIYMNIF